MTDIEEKQAQPLRYGMLVFPGFQALDVFGPLDILNTLAFDTPLELVVIGPNTGPISTRPRAETPVPKPVGNSHQEIVATYTYETAPQIDVLLVPGGLGTRSPLDEIQRAIDYVAKVFTSLTYLITICTGAGIAARAGVLDNKSATTNKKAWAETTALRPQVKWVKHARWVEAEDGKTWTSSGVSAGLDVTFAFVAKVYGEKVAENVANGIEYERHMDPSWDPFADLYDDKL